MKDRYKHNLGLLSESDIQSLHTKSVMVVGLGALGGYICDFFARIGVNEMVIVDFDNFDESNLNRQLNATETSLGKSKVQTQKDRIMAVNSHVAVKSIDNKFDQDFDREIFKGVDIVVDALDNIGSKKLLEATCIELKIPLVFGAVSAIDGMVTTIIDHPKLDKIYSCQDSKKPMVLPYTPAVIAGFQFGEAVRVLLGRSGLAHKMLLVDIENMETRIVRNNV